MYKRILPLKGRIDEAIKLYKTVLQNKNWEVTALRNLALAFEMKKNETFRKEQRAIDSKYCRMTRKYTTSLATYISIQTRLRRRVFGEPSNDFFPENIQQYPRGGPIQTDRNETDRSPGIL
jgi:hypothetical protein